METQKGKERRFQRLRFEQPLAAQFGSVETEVLDLSLQGARLVHLQPLQAGREADLRFRLIDREIVVRSLVLRCKLETPAVGAKGNLYASGIQFTGSAGPLREVIAERVLHALEEQVANKRGDFIPLADRMTIFRSEDVLSLKVPPGQQHAFRPPGDEFVLCTPSERGWRQVRTREQRQPLDGFTVSGLEDPAHIELLCATYRKSDEEMRKMIRMLAEISVGMAQGV
ncbi:MAG TPA: PilZ domain-containing protein [Thermoanaerobaculia bacterium]|nr:PilZ domain-containing protein [Thermoanaerobaculia bacterium]